MSSIEPQEFADVLKRVTSWPATERLTLARRILDTLDRARVVELEEPPRRIPLEQIIGMLKTDAPPPTDEECKRIVEEERMRKYG